MTFTEIRLIVETRLSGWDGVPVAFDGAKISPSVKAAQEARLPWVRLTIGHGESQTTEVGSKPKERKPGLIQCQIFTEEHQGSIEAYKVADALTELLQYWSDGHFETFSSSVQYVGPANGWYQLMHTTPFRGN